MVELDPAVHAAPLPVIEYDAPAPNMAYRAHAAPAPMVEYDAAPTMAYRVYAALALAVEYDAPASTVEYQAHAAPAPVDEYDAPAARAAPFSLSGRASRQGRACSSVQVVEKTSEIPQLQSFEKIVDIPEIQTVQSTESLETAPVLEMAPAERTLRISLADCEGVIEELSKAMEEGAPEALSVVIDEYFEKFDKPDKKHECDHYVCGKWASEKVSPAFSGTAT